MASQRTRREPGTAPDSVADLLWLMASAAQTVDVSNPLFAHNPDVPAALKQLQEVLPELARLVEQAEHPE